MPLLRHDVLLRLGAELLEAASACPDVARAVSEHLVESSLVGLDSHGMMRLPEYLGQLTAGEVVGCGEPLLVTDLGSLVLLDAGDLFGAVGGNAAADLAVARAHEHHVALVCLRHAGHAGRIGAYVERMAHHGVIGLAFCNSPIHGHFVAPPGGREGRLATNPIAYGLPSEGSDVIADFSTSSVPEGVVRLLDRRGVPAPPDTMMTSDGQPTSDPGVLYREPPGAILPLGGIGTGHKGFALSILVQVMAGALAGDRVADRTLRGNNLALIGIAPDGLADLSLPGLVSDLSAYVKSAKPIDPNRPVQMPGDREQLVREQRLREGIPVDDFTWSEMTRWAAQLGHPIEEGQLSDA